MKEEQMIKQNNEYLERSKQFIIRPTIILVDKYELDMGFKNSWTFGKHSNSFLIHLRHKSNAAIIIAYKYEPDVAV